MQGTLKGKRLIEKPRMRWENIVKNYEKELGAGTVWKTRATDRDEWKARCMTVWL